jgi:hypothetical protein
VFVGAGDPARTSLYAALQERRAMPAPDAQPVAPAAQHAPARRAVADSLQAWAGLAAPRREEAPDLEEAPPLPLDEAAEGGDAEGNASMVNALLRFMRPK